MEVAERRWALRGEVPRAELSGYGRNQTGGVGREGRPDRLVGQPGDHQFLGERRHGIEADPIVATTDREVLAVAAEVRLSGAGHVERGQPRTRGDVEDVDAAGRRRRHGDDPSRRVDGHLRVRGVRSLDPVVLADRATRQVVDRQRRRVRVDDDHPLPGKEAVLDTRADLHRRRALCGQVPHHDRHPVARVARRAEPAAGRVIGDRLVRPGRTGERAQRLTARHGELLGHRLGAGGG